MTQDQSTGVWTFAARHGLVRPTQGRYVAGVCAALARATRTDPVLWRVTLAVLICFAGVGAVLYLVIWLLSPEEGDTASPAESLLGRGRSSTSPVLTVVLGLVATALLIFILPRPIYVVLGGAVVLAILLLVNRSANEAATAPAAGPAAAAAPGPEPAPFAPTVPFAPTAPAGPAAPPPAAAPVPPEFSLPPESSVPTVASVPPASPVPPTMPAGPPPPPAWTPPAGYRPPFAPHGPFAGLSTPPPPPPRRKQPRERSALPPLILFAGLMVLATLGAMDLVGLSVPVAGYVAAALAVVGGGLVVGAWLGRARPMIALGIVLALLLPAVHTIEVWDRPEYMADQFSWHPTRVADISQDYELILGDGDLDLTDVDFAGRDVTVAVEVTFGDMRVTVPPDVAVEADVNNRYGSTTVFGVRTDGVTRDTVQNPGSGDAADGTLRLDLRNRFANLEVHREAATR